jgi:hypothetical protein
LKIHSSSLHVSPSGQQANKPKQSPQPFQDYEPAANKNAPRPSRNQEFAAAAEQESQQQITQVAYTEKSQAALNAKALKAIIAYTETFNDR